MTVGVVSNTDATGPTVGKVIAVHWSKESHAVQVAPGDDTATLSVPALTVWVLEVEVVQTA
jgi:hypothetical protein